MSLFAGLVMTCATKPANADPWNKKTYLTFSRSIEVPGAVLPPGKYVFKLLESQSNRHIVQIMNERENHVYATNLAIPKQRMDPADKTIVTFYEMPGGGPEPIHTWFYPGDTIGQEFTYSHKRAMEIRLAMRQSGQSNVTVAENRTTTTTEQTPAAVETSTATAVEADNSANRTVEPTAEPTPEPTPTPEAAASMPETPAPTPEPTPAPEPAMPHTAGNLAAIGLLGLGCLGIATTLRIANQARSKS